MSCLKFYTVLAEDTCYSIAYKNKISWDEFNRINPGIDCKKIETGQIVCISAPKYITSNNNWWSMLASQLSSSNSNIVSNTM